MQIRRASLDDIETLVGYWRDVHARTVFAHLAFDEAKLASVIRGVIGDRSGATCFLVAEKDGEPSGVLVGQIDAYYFSSDPMANGSDLHQAKPEPQSQNLRAPFPQSPQCKV
jgi:hypothetical protein